MAENTNMDMENEEIKDGPMLEFKLPLNELLDQFKTGDKGKIIIPVEVTQVTNEMVSFMKKGPAETYGSFKDRPLDEVREEIGVVED